MMDKMVNEIATSTLTAKVLYTMVVSLFASMAAYLNINAEMLAIYFTLLNIDLITGISAAFILRERITRVRLSAGILSKFMMFIVPLVVALILKMQDTQFLWFMKWSLFVLAVSEGFSIFNNVLRAKGKPTLPELDAIAVIAEKLRAMIEIIFKKGGQ